MTDQKVENQLNLALNATESERKKSIDLNVGYDEINKIWELIIKYNGDIDRFASEEIKITKLSNEYAIVQIPERLIPELAKQIEVEFIEKPKSLYFEVYEGRIESCVNPLQTPDYNLFGNGVIVALLDSGVDYAHPDFRNNDGTTRILNLWDQTIPGNPPAGYQVGTEYTKDKINEALKAETEEERYNIVPSRDPSGHGTHVLGIAAGNGRASDGKNRGLASQSDIIVVKLGVPRENSFPRTVELMEGLDYVIKKAVEYGKPIAVNISFGNSYGSHTGAALLETYIDDMANVWKSAIIIGSGNEGSKSRHTSGVLTEGTNQEIELAVAPFESSVSVQIWKNYYDNFDISFIAPSNMRIGPIQKELGTQKFVMDNVQILLYYGEPSPYNRQQEIYIEMIPAAGRDYLTEGVWKFVLVPKEITNGDFDMWLPAGAEISSNTRFLRPTEVTTLTTPSTALKAITVGAYDARSDSYASFSGRGFTRNRQIKPDIVAPGVNITSAAPGGGYTVKSGTSMATPFVTGAAAMLMQWGIVNGNDPYLYGDDCAIIRLNQRKPSNLWEFPLV